MSSPEVYLLHGVGDPANRSSGRKEHGRGIVWERERSGNRREAAVEVGGILENLRAGADKMPEGCPRARVAARFGHLQENPPARIAVRVKRMTETGHGMAGAKLFRDRGARLLQR